MIEKRFFKEEIPYFSTEKYHADREAAHHLEQEEHNPRLLKAFELIKSLPNVKSVVDFGCGDGGLLSLLKDKYISYGCDFCPDNVKYANEVRKVNVYHENFTNNINSLIYDLVVMTEVLEHMAEPHKFLKDLSEQSEVKYIICSSPWNETELETAGGHVWAFDREAYAKMITNAGWTIISHEDVVPRFQIILAKR